jgi:periplasmic copper chaperone A
MTAPEAKPGVSLASAELVLPVLAGRPGAVYFQITNDSDQPVSLVSAYVEGATSAEIHGMSGGMMEKRDAIAIKPGEAVVFERGGLHVMAFELADSLAAGGTSELTLTFADGDKISAPLTIIAGGSSGAMQGMDH